MLVRKTRNEDVDQIIEIIEEIKEYLRINNIDQWQDNYPNKEVIKDDIAKGISFVVSDNGRVIGTSVLSFQEEETYNNIHEGKWLNNSSYGVIHRIAVINKGMRKGIGRFIYEEIERMCIKNEVFNIRVDTHEDNHNMKAFLLSQGFIYCGIIYLKSGAKRQAYQKILVR
ncbi:GNAT family N-acetyltransferase [Haploplasma axanthum]|uniref:Acetyltransferase (GNAT) family n=1 Tax=Haploplasma axanthum TaxID=29552 RepID=A0A449BBE4_HAPAX|nr:GNAT family N-acetyltransferase [Haploplasma axanthum]VEU79727.1 Acetyltransferase (GNAT) family [Haploplasma axanthum]